MKSKTTKIIIWLASIMAASFIIAALVLFFTGGISVSKKQIDQSEIFDGAAVNTISVNTVSSKINIMESDTNQIKVDYYGQVSTNINQNIPRLSANQSQGRLDIEIVHPKGISFGISIQDTVLDIYIPSNGFDSFSIENTSGDCSIAKLETKEFIYSNISGHLDAAYIEADNSKMNSTSGDILIKGYSGNIEAKSVSGDIVLEDGKNNEDLYIETTSGEIDIWQNQASNMDLKTISGRVELKMNRDAEFDLSIDTISGDIENIFPVSITGNPDRGLRGIVGKEGQAIVIETVSGDIDINYLN